MILPFELDTRQLKLIDKRLAEFKQIYQKDNNTWFSELCFCILTANSQAQKAINIQEELNSDGFLLKTEEEIAETIKRHKHRFHNNKAKYIVQAREFKNIKNLLGTKNGFEAREFIAKNIKGLGYKEASHFLRNVGYSDVAIIDRHIIKFLFKYKFIDSIPKIITKKIYFEFENILKQFNSPLDRLDLTIWCYMTGKVLK